MDIILPGCGNDLRIMRIQDQGTLPVDQLLIRELGDFLKTIRVIEQNTEISNPPDA